MPRRRKGRRMRIRRRGKMTR
ncbi:hypothetical protein NXF25_020005 [Crotalus adamanteus]|uniref:60S ribosomal protein L41 n=1 Tax=Crotalus adamanteus TaxID=8729 RepID=A0AAW1B3J7_CROAD